MALEAGIAFEIKKGGNLPPFLERTPSSHNRGGTMSKPHRINRKKWERLEGYFRVFVLALKLLYLLILIWKLI